MNINDKISETMGLSEITNRQWAIFKCSVKQNVGVEESMEWFSNILSNKN